MVRKVSGLLPFKQWGGARKGAGRKPGGEQPGVRHERRAVLAKRYPVHVTMKFAPLLPPLRRKAEYVALRAAFCGGCDRFGFRLVHYAVLDNHLHFLVEAADRASLTRGLRGLTVRVARALNRVWRDGTGTCSPTATTTASWSRPSRCAGRWCT